MHYHIRRFTIVAIAALTLAATAGLSQDAPPAADPPQVTPPPPFTKWAAQTRWDEAQTLEYSAGYDKLKVADSIAAWQMFLDLYPRAGMANEAAWHITTLTTRLGQLPKTIAAYEGYAASFPDGDYAEDALWNVTYQYMGVPDWETVYDTYDRFLQRFPASPYGDVALNGLASNAQTKKRYDLAIELYQELLKRYPTSDYCDNAWSGLGAASSARYDTESTAEAYMTLAQQYPRSDLVESGLMSLVLTLYSEEPLQCIELGRDYMDTYPHSPYASTVQMYMYYASMSLRTAMPGLNIERPDPYDPNDPTVILSRGRTEAYDRARRAANLLELSDAIALYEGFMRDYPTASQVDDCLYGIGDAYAKLETYVSAAKKAKTPKQFSQVESDWRWVTDGAAGVAHGEAAGSAVDAYLQLVRAMPGSDLRDDALYKTGVAYESAEDWVSAIQAYIALIRVFPVSAHARTAVGRLEALKSKLKQPEDIDTVMRAVVQAYPHYSQSDDYVYELGIGALKKGDVSAARDLFARYVATYPNRSKAASALFWNARCAQLLGRSREAWTLYAQLANAFVQSGLADDGYVECQHLADGSAEAVMQAAQEALNLAARAMGEPVVGYDAIMREHITILAPSDKAIDIRAYNLVDRLEMAYGLMAEAAGGAPRGGQRIVIAVDPKVAAPTQGDPARIPPTMVATPPPWRQWFELVAGAFTHDPQLNPVATAMPAFADGLARFAGVQLEEMVFTELGDITVGPAAMAAHLGDLNRIKNTGAAALGAHVAAKGAADQISADIAMAMIWHLSTAISGDADTIINWSPVLPLLSGGKAIPAAAVTQAETLEQKAALTAHWINSSLGADYTATLRAWGMPLTPEEMAAVQAAVDAAQPQE
ncbi:MAG TPA: tetratricopeptide repeat protein [Armatimonadota bacterium]|nr:tetratricopeptide repeat protein [Armatimonadota bacterium]